MMRRITDNQRLIWANAICITVSLVVFICMIYEITLFTSIFYTIYKNTNTIMSNVTILLMRDIPRWILLTCIILIIMINILKEYLLKSLNSKLLISIIILSLSILIFIFYLYFIIQPLANEYFFYNSRTFASSLYNQLVMFGIFGEWASYWYHNTRGSHVHQTPIR